MRKARWIAALAVMVAGCTTIGGNNGIGDVNLPAPVLEAPLAASETMMVAPAIVVPAPTPSTRQSPRADVVTAGDIDDTLNLPAFLRYQNAAARELRAPGADLSRPVLARLRGPSGAPAPGVRFTLREVGASGHFYDGYSGVDGAITIFPSVLGQQRLRNVELRAFPNGDGAAAVTRLNIGTDRNVVTLPFESTWSPDFLDLVFVVDTTGSMGDELAWLAREIEQIAQRARAAAPGVDIRFGLVTYKAPADPYVIRNYGFTSRASEFTRWVRAERPSGGAGGPEVVADALTTAMQMAWRRGRGERLVFQIGDEPPQMLKSATYYRAASIAAANGIQIFGVGASGAEAQLEFLMRQGAAISGGRYLFLTDDSGVGLGHAEPTISCYRVTALNDLMARVIRSELGGRRIEAAPGDVVRTVGSYQGGICRN